MSHSTGPGAQQYSDEEFAAIADEAHRAGVRVAAHAVGDTAIRACIQRRDRLHRARLPRHRRHDSDDGRSRHLPGVDHLFDRGDGVDRIAPELRKKAEASSPRKGNAAQGDCRRSAHRVRHRRTGDPARPERQGARARWWQRGMTPMQAIRAATVTGRRARRGRRRAGPPRARLPRRRHRRARRSLEGHRRHARRFLRHEGRSHLQDTRRGLLTGRQAWNSLTTFCGCSSRPSTSR